MVGQFSPVQSEAGMRSVFLVPILIVILIFASTVASFAQITSATISGTIKDQTGAVLPGVDVVVKNVDTGLTRSIVTDANGYFTVPGLPPGTYETRATLQGFGIAVERVTLAVAQEAGLNLTLKVTGTEESITVVGTSALVDTRSAAMSAVVTEKTISELPLNGRNYIDLALLQPGVSNFSEKDSTSSSNRGTKLNINGMGFRSNSYLLDGANMRGYAGTATVSAAETTLGVETIQEFRVVTNAYSADYGRAMGGVISLVTKSGTNHVHGSGFEFFRDSSMDARNFFDRGSQPPPFRRNQFGTSAGGPIRKNRLFFFGGIERLQEDLGVTTTSFVPSEAARSGAFAPINPVMRRYLDLYPQPNAGDVGVNTGIGQYSYEFNQPTRENFYQGRVDYTVSDKDSIFARYTYDGANQRVTAGFPDFATNSVSKNQFFTSEYKRIISPALLNTARFSHSRLRFEQLPDFLQVPDLAFIAGQNEIGVINVGGWSGLGGTTTNPSSNNSFYWTASDDVSYVKGRHLLKSGALIEHLRTNKLTATNIRGSYTFANVRAFLAGTPTRFVGVPPGAQLERVRPNTLFGFYVQDDYRTTDRLTLNLGLRYEFYTLPAEMNGLDTTLRDIFSVSVQRELAAQITATVGYAGSRAHNLMSAIEANPIVPVIQADGTKFFPGGAPRRNPAFGPIDYRTNGGRSEYNSLQLSAQKRFSRRYQLQAAYTLSKAMDNLQAQLNADVNNSSVYPQDPYDREIDWARSDFDVRHVFSTNFVWDLPGRESSV